MQFELGLNYDQLQVGMKASFSKTVTETDVYLFAGISGDFNPMHVNEEFARLTPFGTAHCPWRSPPESDRSGPGNEASRLGDHSA